MGIIVQRAGIIGKGTRHVALGADVLDPLNLDGQRLRGSGLLGRLGRQTLSSTGNDVTIVDVTLNQPMVIARAELALVDTSLAEVVVTIVAHAAVVVDVVHGGITAVAIDRPGGRRECSSIRSGAKS